MLVVERGRGGDKTRQNLKKKKMEKRGKIWETEEEDRDTFAELKERAGMKAARLALHFVMITINCVARFHVDDSVYLFYSR